MPVLILLLLVGVLAYFWWKRATTTLTRDCRWRLNKATGNWRCAYCGAQRDGAEQPLECLRGSSQ